MMEEEDPVMKYLAPLCDTIITLKETKTSSQPDTHHSAAERKEEDPVESP